MKRLLFVCVLLAWACTAVAQSTCPSPSQKAVIFFGNGIATTQSSAKYSLNLLREAVGDSYNGQALRYDLAYNQTDGMALDLAQSVLQAGAQWDSQIMGWFNTIGVAPDWFTSWYERYLLAATTVFVPELGAQVEKYRTAILFGQKVLVVSHSQGNFYVNEAKKLLADSLTPEQLKAFAIFGVAVPANNVGGSSGPYYTNHRDLILNVLGAMPYNWTLHHAGGGIADDVPRLNAHYFNSTYMSDDFDMKPALLIGIKGLLAATPASDPVCTDNYQKRMLGMFAGKFSCFGPTGTKIGEATVGVDAKVSVMGQAFDAGSPEVAVFMASEATEGNVGFIAAKQIDVRTTVAMASGGTSSWAGKFGTLMVSNDLSSSGTSCLPKDADSGEPLNKPITLGVEAASLMFERHGTFPPKHCLTISGSSSVLNSRAVPYYVIGNILTVGTQDYDLDGAPSFEDFNIYDTYSNNLYSQLGDTFNFKTQYANGDFLDMIFERYRGIRSFVYTTSSSMLSCVQPK